MRTLPLAKISDCTTGMVHLLDFCGWSPYFITEPMSPEKLIMNMCHDGNAIRIISSLHRTELHSVIKYDRIWLATVDDADASMLYLKYGHVIEKSISREEFITHYSTFKAVAKSSDDHILFLIAKYCRGHPIIVSKQ